MTSSESDSSFSSPSELEDDVEEESINDDVEDQVETPDISR